MEGHTLRTTRGTITSGIWHSWDEGEAGMVIGPVFEALVRLSTRWRRQRMILSSGTSRKRTNESSILASFGSVFCSLVQVSTKWRWSLSQRQLEIIRKTKAWCRSVKIEVAKEKYIVEEKWRKENTQRRLEILRTIKEKFDEIDKRRQQQVTTYFRLLVPYSEMVQDSWGKFNARSSYRRRLILVGCKTKRW